jgi:hypothetical protein
MENRNGKYVTFRTVEYMQLPTYWENANFQLATKNECLDLLKSLNIQVFEKIPYLFYAQLPTSRVNIVFYNVRISETSPWNEEKI